MVMNMQPVQCRMARSALALGVRELAAYAKVSTDTVSRFEREEDLRQRTIEAMQRVFEDFGIEFTNGDTPGVKFRREMTPLNQTRIASYIAAGCTCLNGCKGVAESDIKIVARPNEPRNWDAEISSLPCSGLAMAEAKEMIAWLRGRITLMD
jgi:transcriptional regulator with XRE-family HTH domain